MKFADGGGLRLTAYRRASAVMTLAGHTLTSPTLRQLIKVQTGDYWGKNGIVRFKNTCGRGRS